MTEAEFWSRITPEPMSGCWAWDSVGNHLSAGRATVNGRSDAVHRLSFELASGQTLGSLFACHKCDNRWCVNPSHIFAGTALDNTQDCLNKGRKARASCETRGITIPNLMRRRLEKKMSQAALAKRTGTTRQAISKIEAGGGASLHTAVALAEVFDLSVRDLMGST